MSFVSFQLRWQLSRTVGLRPMRRRIRLPAFHLAWEMEADAIEGDFRLTKDGQVVCIHDADTERVGDLTLDVESTDYSSLKVLMLAVPRRHIFHC